MYSLHAGVKLPNLYFSSQCLFHMDVVSFESMSLHKNAIVLDMTLSDDKRLVTVVLIFYTLARKEHVYLLSSL